MLSTFKVVLTPLASTWKLLPAEIITSVYVPLALFCTPVLPPSFNLTSSEEYSETVY